MILRDQGSGIRDQGSGVRGQGSGVRGQGVAWGLCPPHEQLPAEGRVKLETGNYTGYVLRVTGHLLNH